MFDHKRHAWTLRNQITIVYLLQACHPVSAGLHTHADYSNVTACIWLWEMFSRVEVGDNTLDFISLDKTRKSICAQRSRKMLNWCFLVKGSKLELFFRLKNSEIESNSMEQYTYCHDNVCPMLYLLHIYGYATLLYIYVRVYTHTRDVCVDALYACISIHCRCWIMKISVWPSSLGKVLVTCLIYTILQQATAQVTFPFICIDEFDITDSH